jgi:hypothetical protein
MALARSPRLAAQNRRAERCAIPFLRDPRRRCGLGCQLRHCSPLLGERNALQCLPRSNSSWFGLSWPGCGRRSGGACNARGDPRRAGLRLSARQTEPSGSSAASCSRGTKACRGFRRKYGSYCSLQELSASKHRRAANRLPRRKTGPLRDSHDIERLGTACVRERRLAHIVAVASLGCAGVFRDRRFPKCRLLPENSRSIHGSPSGRPRSLCRIRREHRGCQFRLLAETSECADERSTTSVPGVRLTPPDSRRAMPQVPADRGVVAVPSTQAMCSRAMQTFRGSNTTSSSARKIDFVRKLPKQS